MNDIIEMIKKIMVFTGIDENKKIIYKKNIEKKRAEFDKYIMEFCFYGLSFPVLIKYNVLEKNKEQENSYYFTEAFWDAIREKQLDRNDRMKIIIDENNIYCPFYYITIHSRTRNMLPFFIYWKIRLNFNDQIKYCENRKNEEFGDYIVDDKIREEDKREQRICELCGSRIRKQYNYCSGCGMKIER